MEPTPFDVTARPEESIQAGYDGARGKPQRYGCAIKSQAMEMRRSVEVNGTVLWKK